MKRMEITAFGGGHRPGRWGCINGNEWFHQGEPWKVVEPVVYGIKNLDELTFSVVELFFSALPLPLSLVASTNIFSYLY